MTEYVDRPPAGWHTLDVMPEKTLRSRRWVALLIDMEPEAFKYSTRKCQSRWLRIPGKHKNRDAAWDALTDMLCTRH